MWIALAVAITPSPNVAPAPPPVVVTAPRPASSYADVRAATTPREGKLTRLAVPVCPHVMGFAPEVDATVEAVIRTTARRAGLSASRPGCTGTLVVMISRDPRGVLRDAERKQRGVFASLTPMERYDLDHGPGPAWSWQSTQVNRSDGGPTAKETMRDSGNEVDVVNNAPNSHIVTDIRYDATGAYVVLDREALEGLTLQQVADVALVKGLASLGAAPAEAAPRGSVLTVLDPVRRDSAPAQATRFDVALLRAIHQGQNNVPASQRLAEITREVRQEMRADAAAPPGQ